MVDWWLLIVSFVFGGSVGAWVTFWSDKKVVRAATLGVIGTLLALLGLN